LENAEPSIRSRSGRQASRLNAWPARNTQCFATSRILLLEYVAEANALAEKSAFYNSLTTNCTTAVAKLIRAAGGALPFDWRLIVNGYLPGYLYD